VFFLPKIVFAASLSVTSDSPTVTAGTTFGATVYLDSSNSSINASDGELSFSPDLLKAESVVYSNSIFTLWAQEPTIDNTNGIVSWSGGSNSGFSGTHGRVLRVIFVAKKSGVNKFLLPTASIYADDGLGTNVGTTPSVSSVTIANAPEQSPTVPAPIVTAIPLGDERIAVSSPTHPSESAWYASTTALLLLRVPKGADAIRTILATNKDATPAIMYQPPLAQKSLDSLVDGVQYFNVRGHYSHGWGPVTSYTLQVDTTPPTFSDISIFYTATSSMLSVYATASDELSGIRNYALVVDDTAPIVFTQNDLIHGSYRSVLPLSTGVHKVQIRVFDNAGNKTDSKIFDIVGPDQGVGTHTSLSWLSHFSLNDWTLFIALLLSFFSVLMNIVLYARLRRHERRRARHFDARKIRALTIDQLTVFEKEMEAEIRILEHIRERRDITIQENEDIKQIHKHLVGLVSYVRQKIEEIEKQ
jgi:hypothetical protein